jgi:hypothetical protein
MPQGNVVKLPKKYIKVEIRIANFYFNIPLWAEYITRAKREYHLGKAQISSLSIGKRYHCNIINMNLMTLQKGGVYREEKHMRHLGRSRLLCGDKKGAVGCGLYSQRRWLASDRVRRLL